MTVELKIVTGDIPVGVFEHEASPATPSLLQPGKGINFSLKRFFRGFFLLLITIVYFLIYYSPPGNLSPFLMYFLQTSTGYRPPNHPFYLYFAPQLGHRLRSDLGNHPATHLKQVVDQICSSPSSQSMSSHQVSNEEKKPRVTSTSLWSKFAKNKLENMWHPNHTLSFPRGGGNKAESKIAAEADFVDSIKSTLLGNDLGIGSEIVLVDELKYSESEYSDGYSIQREVTYNEDGKQFSHGRTFIQVPNEVRNSADIGDASRHLKSGDILLDKQGQERAQSSSGGNSIWSCLGSILNPTCEIKFYVDVSDTVREEAGIHIKSVAQRFLVWFLHDESDLRIRRKLKSEARHFNAILSGIMLGRSAPSSISVSRKFIRVIDTSLLKGVNRYAVKTHFISPFQANLDYPLSTAFVQQSKLDDFVSPNAISFIHLCCGFMAGFCFWTSSVRLRTRSLDVSNTHSTLIPSSGIINRLFFRFNALLNAAPRHYIALGYTQIETFSNLFSSRTLVHAGCALYVLRNWLDTVDGVVARMRKGRVSVSEQQFGQLVDIVADGLGCTVANFGILFMIYNQECQLSHFFLSSIRKTPLYTLFGPDNRSPKRSLFLSRAVGFVGLLLPGISALIWEVFMLRYTRLVELLNTNEASHLASAIESNLYVRSMWFLWALCGGDNLINIFIISLLWGDIWTTVQFSAVFGYCIVLGVFLYSTFVWNFVTLSDSDVVSFWQQL